MGKKLSRLKYQATELVVRKYEEWKGNDDIDRATNNDAVTSFDPNKVPKSSGDVDVDLYKAAFSDNVIWVEKLLKLGADGLAPQGEYDLTSLHVCMSARVAARIVASLPKITRDSGLKKIRDSRGNTPLHSAARSNRQEALLCLIECGFDIQWKNDAGRTAARVAFTYNNIDTSNLLNKLATGHCWCGEEFDLEEACQLYLNIYSYREICQDVYSYIMDQKKEDMRDELELRKKLNPLLQSQAERKAWAAERKQEATKEQGGTDIKGALATAMKAMEKFDREMKRQEAAERAGLEYKPPEDDDSDEDGPASPKSSKKSSGGKKEKTQSLKVRIKKLEKELEIISDPARWRATCNSLGFPHDITEAAQSLVAPSLALHVRIGCPTRSYICEWCQEEIMRQHEEVHVKTECQESMEKCPQCTGMVKIRLLKHHIKNECLAREWVFCPNLCGKEMRSKEMRKHMAMQCELRKKKCRSCGELCIFKHFDRHQMTDCIDHLVPCKVIGCERQFHIKSDAKWIVLHQKAHLQKHVELWSPGETAFWFEHTFPFFGDFLLSNYKKRIIAKNINGKVLIKKNRSKDLRQKILMKVIGMPEDHAYTVSEAIMGKAPADERWAEHPKRVRVGAFLSENVRQDVRIGMASRTTSPYICTK